MLISRIPRGLSASSENLIIVPVHCLTNSGNVLETTAGTEVIQHSAQQECVEESVVAALASKRRPRVSRIPHQDDTTGRQVRQLQVTQDV